jgi:ATP-dependent Clp protease, protease subunit
MKKWYRIEAKAAEKKAVILIYEQIGENFFGEGVSAKRFIEDLNALGVENIDLHINSPGGRVFDGNAIYNALKKHPATIHVFIDGLAASIASVIAMAGDTVEMPQNAMMMIHDPSISVFGATADDLLKKAEALEKVKVGLVAAYHGRTDLDKDKISEMMAAETWMTAAEAVDYGFADEVTEQVDIAACYAGDMFDHFKNTPQQFLNAGPSGRQTPKKEDPVMEKYSLPEITAEFLSTNLPDVVAAMVKDAAAVAAKTERERIQAVRDQLIPGHEELINRLAMDGTTTGEQAAVQVLAAERQVRATVAANLVTDGPAPVPPAVPPATDPPADTVDPDAPIEDQAKAEWKKSKDLRAEFMDDFDAYLAFRQAEANGQVRILKK